MVLIKSLYGIICVVLFLYLVRIYLKEGIEVKWVCIFTYSWYYFLIPFMIIVFNIGKGGTLVFTKVIFDSTEEVWLLAFGRSIFALFIIALIFESYITHRTTINDYSYISISEKNIKEIRNVGYFLLVVGGGSLLILFHELGGISNAIALGSQIRAYLSSNATYLSALGSMFKTLAGLIQGAGYCFLSVFFVTKKRKDKVLFCISLVLTFLYIFFNAGRSNLVFMVGIYVFGYCRLKRIDIVKPGIVLAVLVIIFAGPLGYIIDNIAHQDFSFANMSLSAMTGNYKESLLEFSYPTSNLLASSEMNHIYGYRLFVDYFTWIPSMLPSRVLRSIGINIGNYELITIQNSAFYISMGSRGGTPVDILTLGVRQIPILGITINAIILAYFAKRIRRIAYSFHPNYSFVLWFLYVFIFDMIISSDLGAMLKANIAEVIILIVLLRIERRCKLESIDNRRCGFDMDQRILSSSSVIREN